MNPKQIQAIADDIVTQMKRNETPPVSIEGYSEGRWILIDCSDVIIHLFLDGLREYYDLDGLWADAPRIPLPAEVIGPATHDPH